MVHTTLVDRVRAACQAPFAPKSIGCTNGSLQDRIEHQFRHFETFGEFSMFADGAVFIEARLTSIDDMTASILWESAFYPGPRYRQAILEGHGELLPLGFHGRFDLYLQQPAEMPGDAHGPRKVVSPNGAQAVVLAKSSEGEATTVDSRNGMPADVVRALCEGTVRARLLAAGPAWGCLAASSGVRR